MSEPVKIVDTTCPLCNFGNKFAVAPGVEVLNCMHCGSAVPLWPEFGDRHSDIVKEIQESTPR